MNCPTCGAPNYQPRMAERSKHFEAAMRWARNKARRELGLPPSTASQSPAPPDN